MSSTFWNDRYAADGLVYGELPNEFLVSMRLRLPTAGRALDIGAGEGRNALFLASLGLDVLAVDQSDVGLAKAQRLAQERGLRLGTHAADLAEFTAEPGSLDLVTSIFCHLPAALRAAVHARAHDWLRPGGLLLIEAYAPDQLQRQTGGPKDPALLASLDTLLSELTPFEILHGAALTRNVSEGQYHTGDASVVQVLARRN